MQCETGHLRYSQSCTPPGTGNKIIVALRGDAFKTYEGGKTVSTLQYPGGKKRIAKWIISFMPPHHSYIEPFFGTGGVFFAKQPSDIETINDIDGEVINFFEVLREAETRRKLIEWIAYTPYSRQIFNDAYECRATGPIEQAGYFAVKIMQTHGFRTTSDHGGWKKDIHGREKAYGVRHWNELPDTLMEMAVRLKMVQIEHRPALEVIRAFNHPDVLIYADPPYVLSTRCRPMYRYEMTDQDHRELLYELCKSKAKIMLSGYDCPLYAEYLSSWRKERILTRAQNNSQREEILWMNFEQEQIQMKL